MTMIIKMGGAVCHDPALLQQLVTEWNRRGRPPWVLVHGGGPQLDKALAAQFGAPERIDGLRITTPAAAMLVAQTLDLVGRQLAAALESAGAPTIHLGGELQLLNAVPKTVPGGDLQRVGTVTTFNAAEFRVLVPAGHLGVVTPVGWDANGPLNVNADEGAVAVAIDLGANRLVLGTDVDGVRDERGATRSVLTSAEAADLIGGAAQGGMIPKLNNALSALAAGVHHVDIGRPQAAWSTLASCTQIRPVQVVAA